MADVLRRDRSLAITDATDSPILSIAANLKPHVAFISASVEGDRRAGFEVLRGVRSAAPDTRVVMLLDSSEREAVVEAFRSGARGVFCRSDSLKMLTRCVHRVHEGELWLSAMELKFLVETLVEAPAAHLVDTQGTPLLSKREEDVVRWLAEGFTNRAIARELKLSENTVKNYLFRIFNKLGVSSRVEVVIYAASQWALNKPVDMLEKAS